MGCAGELQRAASGLPPFERGAGYEFHDSRLFKMKERTTESISHKPSDLNYVNEKKYTIHNLQNMKENIAFPQEMTSPLQTD